MNYWLFKTEPTTFGIDDLAKRAKQTEPWNGVRNYQARNYLRNEVKLGDEVLFYHSSCEPPGIAGIARVVKAGYPDDTAFDPKSEYYDAATSPANPRWFMVDVKLIKKFSHFITLAEIKHNPALKNMVILRKGNRLSITPVTKSEWQAIMKMADKTLSS